jgi:protein translocase SecG subunit
MEFIASILPFVQIGLSVLLITAVLLQARGSSVGGAFGGDNMGTTFYTRRGAERVLFRLTIAVGVLFALTAFATLYL